MWKNSTHPSSMNNILRLLIVASFGITIFGQEILSESLSIPVVDELINIIQEISEPLAKTDINKTGNWSENDNSDENLRQSEEFVNNTYTKEFIPFSILTENNSSSFNVEASEKVTRDASEISDMQSEITHITTPMPVKNNSSIHTSTSVSTSFKKVSGFATIEVTANPSVTSEDSSSSSKVPFTDISSFITMKNLSDQENESDPTVAIVESSFTPTDLTSPAMSTKHSTVNSVDSTTDVSPSKISSTSLPNTIISNQDTSALTGNISKFSLTTEFVAISQKQRNNSSFPSTKSDDLSSPLVPIEPVSVSSLLTTNLKITSPKNIEMSTTVKVGTLISVETSATPSIIATSEIHGTFTSPEQINITELKFHTSFPVDTTIAKKADASTSSIEASASSTEASTSSTEASISSTETSISSTEASTSSTEESTSSTEESTSSTEESTSSTEESTSSTDTSTSSSDASTSSTDASTSSTDASTSSTDASTSSTEESSAPVSKSEFLFTSLKGTDTLSSESTIEALEETTNTPLATRVSNSRTIKIAVSVTCLAVIVLATSVLIVFYISLKKQPFQYDELRMLP